MSTILIFEVWWQANSEERITFILQVFTELIYKNFILLRGTLLKLLFQIDHSFKKQKCLSIEYLLSFSTKGAPGTMWSCWTLITFNYKSTLVQMQRKVPSATCKPHPYTAVWNNAITTVVYGQKSGLWNMLWHIKTDDRYTYGLTVTPFHRNAASMHLRYRLLLDIFWKWYWKLSDCNLVTVKAERNCV